MPDHDRAVLRVEPEMIPRLRSLLLERRELVGPELTDPSRGGRVLEPWMADPVSVRMRDVDDASVREAPDGGCAALRASGAEPRRVHRELGRMEAGYRRTEDENAARSGGRA